MPAEFWNRLSELTGDLVRSTGPTQFILDFDGTIAPIVPVPSQARLDPIILAVLPRICETADLTILSGRPAEFLVDQLSFLKSAKNAANIRIFGHYGLESVDIFGHLLSRFEPDPGEVVLLDQMKQIWLNSPIPGILFEDKGYSIAFHFRNAQDQRALLLDWIDLNLPTHGLAIRPGKMVYEVAPGSAPTKETTVMAAISGHKRAIFAGDDYGDMGVFQLFRESQATGLKTISILVQGGFETPPELLSICDIAVPNSAMLGFVLDRIYRVLFLSQLGFEAPNESAR